MPQGPRTVLVGCVKMKRAHRAPAKDLYVSPLWRGRRAYAEENGAPWFILSARHGLVAPDEPLEPYDLALLDSPVAARSEWGENVVADLVGRLGPLEARVLELELQTRIVEEPYLSRTHGEVYDAYAARVGRFLPAVGRIPRS